MNSDEAGLLEILLASPLVERTLSRLDGCGLPGWVLGAGAVAPHRSGGPGYTGSPRVVGPH